MDIAALIAWIVTAVGGFYLLATWVRNGGARPGSSSHFPPALIFGHFALAASGLVVWIVYVATDATAAAWIAFALLVPVAALGFTMLARWIPVYRAQAVAMAGAEPAGSSSSTHSAPGASTAEPAERHFPPPVVVGHGLLAVTTVVLVLLAAAGVGGS